MRGKKRALNIAVSALLVGQIFGSGIAVEAVGNNNEIIGANQLDYRVRPEELSIHTNQLSINYQIEDGYYPEKITIVYPKYEDGSNAASVREKITELRNGGLDNWSAVTLNYYNVPSEEWRGSDNLLINYHIGENGALLEKNLEHSLFYVVQFSRLADTIFGLQYDGTEPSIYLSGEWNYQACGNYINQLELFGNTICSANVNNESGRVNFAWRDQPEDEIEKLREETLKAKEEELARLENELQNQLEELRRQWNDLYGQLDDLQQQKEDLQHQLGELLIQENDLNTQEDILKTWEDQLKDQEEDLEQQKDEVATRIEEMDRRLAEISAVLTKLNNLELPTIERITSEPMSLQPIYYYYNTETSGNNTNTEALLRDIANMQSRMREEQKRLAEQINEPKDNDSDSVIEVPNLGAVEDESKIYWIFINALILVGSIIGWMMYFRERRAKRK